MSAFMDLIEKWVKHNHPEKMPGLEVCIYEASLIDGLDWAAEEGAEQLAQLRAQVDEARKVIEIAVNMPTHKVSGTLVSVIDTRAAYNAASAYLSKYPKKG